MFLHGQSSAAYLGKRCSAFIFEAGSETFLKSWINWKAETKNIRPETEIFRCCDRWPCGNPQIWFNCVSKPPVYPSSSLALPWLLRSSVSDNRHPHGALEMRANHAKKEKDGSYFRCLQCSRPGRIKNYLCVSSLSSSRLTNGFSATRLCLPQLPRIITAEGSSAGLKRSGVFFFTLLPPLPLHSDPIVCPQVTVHSVTPCFLRRDTGTPLWR